LFALLHRTVVETEVKKSRFIAIAAPVDSPDAALAFIEAERDPQATHNCWAFRTGSRYRFSDDGEPGGTAGRPILSAIEGQRVDNAVVLVIRHFGGIKLGAGGLVRAYAGAASACLRAAEKQPLICLVDMTFTAPFDTIGIVHGLISRTGSTLRSEIYTESGVVFELRVPGDQHGVIAEELRNATAGAIDLPLAE